VDYTGGTADDAAEAGTRRKFIKITGATLSPLQSSDLSADGWCGRSIAAGEPCRNTHAKTTIPLECIRSQLS
jgi:hypothetical protein